ncbi:MAG: hypothetical protein MI920_14410 [Kiloniellales bacterium]|nr:hypothetical protein [Kiloniellales bacterium]
MPYVVRDENGAIISVLAQPGNGAERLDASDDELQRFFFESEDANAALQEVLVASDLSFVRVLEDLIGVLLEKGVIMLTDLPEAAQIKIMQRRDIRSQIQTLGDLIGDQRDEDDLLI